MSTYLADYSDILVLLPLLSFYYLHNNFAYRHILQKLARKFRTLCLRRFQFQDVMMFRRLNVSMFYHQHQISCVLQKLLRFVPTKMLKISFLSMNHVLLNQRGWQDYQEWKGRKVQRKSWRFFNQEGKPKISRKIFYCVSVNIHTDILKKGMWRWKQELLCSKKRRVCQGVHVLETLLN